MTGSKRKSEADGEAEKAMARARKFLADHGIDCVSPIHREDAAGLMVEFAKLEMEFSEQVKTARKVMKDNHDALRQLADL
jgi:stage V sporulation protein SpoVS